MTLNHDDDHGDVGEEFSLPSEIVPVAKPARVIVQQPMQRASVISTGTPPSAAEDMDITRYVHSLRRNWLLGIVLGVISAGPLAALAWILNPWQYDAVEYVRISPSHTPLVFETVDTKDTSGRFDFKSYKNTQRQLLMQPFALNTALKDSQVSKLPFIRDHADPIGWLSKNLKVTFPDEAEIMMVSLTLEDPVAAHLIVKSVVETYMKDVVEKERSERMSRVERLEKALVEAENNVRQKRGELSSLVDSLGTGDSTTLNLVQQSAFQQFSALRSELSKITFELMRSKGELQARTHATNPPADSTAAKKSNPDAAVTSEKQNSADAPSSTEKPNVTDNGTNAAVSQSTQTDIRSNDDGHADSTVTNSSATGNTPANAAEVAKGPSAKQVVSDAMLEEAIEHDPDAMKYTKDVTRYENLIKQTRSKYGPKTAETFIKKYQTQLDEAKQKLADRITRLKRLVMERVDQIQGGGSTANLNRIENLPLKIEVLEKQEQQLREEMKLIEKESKKLGRSSIDVEMLRKSIDGIDPLVSKISQEIERTKIELQSTSRITLYPTTGIPHVGNSKLRIPLTAAAGVLGLFGPLMFLVLRDYFKNHLNHIGMMSDSAKINVLGSIPRVPPNVMRRINDPSYRNAAYWRERVAESVTAVTAMLLRKLASDGNRVILITSASSGEGKSTLAEQLARSLAASGHRTLLIDFDLRRPVLHKRFNLPIGEGVSEILRTGVELKQVAIQTDAPNLTLLTAGITRGNLMLEAANGTLASFFKQCRAEFELVVVDSSPMLPVVDGRLVGQFADGSILTVVKDTSKIPQIMATRKILDDYGVPLFGCVVTGDSSDNYYDSYSHTDEASGSVARAVTASRSMSAM